MFHHLLQGQLFKRGISLASKISPLTSYLALRQAVEKNLPSAPQQKRILTFDIL